MAALENVFVLSGRPSLVPSTSGRISKSIPHVFHYATSSLFLHRPKIQAQLRINHRLITHAASDVASSSGNLENTNEWVEVGIVGPPHGVRGEFKVQPLTDFPEERLGEPGPRWLQAPAPKIGRLSDQTPPEEVELEWGRQTVFKGRDVWIVKLEGIDSPEEAAFVRGHTILISAGARDPLEDEDEFYVQELVGLKVVMDKSGELVGKVVDLFDGTGTHDVLRIELSESYALSIASASEESADAGSEEEKKEEGKKKKGRRQVMLPFVKDLVPVVDLEGGVMRIQPPEGLFELAVEAPVKRKRKENAGKRERRNQRPKAKPKASDSQESAGNTLEESSSS